MQKRGLMSGRNLVLLLTLGALWGTAFMFISMGVGEGKAWREVPVQFAAYRFDIAGLALLGVALVRRAKLWPRGGAQWSAIGIAALLNVCAYHAFLFWGQRFTTAAVAAVIIGLNPILTMVFSRALLSDERVGWGGVVGLLMGLGGVVALATMKEGSILDAKGVGEVMVIAAVASWAIGSTLVRRTRHGLDVFAFTAWQMLVGAAFLHVVSLFTEGFTGPRWDGEAVLSLLYLAIASSAVGFVIYFTLLERVGPIRSNLVSYIAPLFAAVASFLVLGEPFELRAVFAFALIAGGFSLVARPAPAAARSS